jgi:hypothetical protein
MNEAWGVMMFAFSVALFGIALLAISLLRLPVKVHRPLSHLGRILSVASFLALIAVFLLRPLLVGYLEHIALFGAPVAGLLASLFATHRFLKQTHETHRAL